MSTKTFFKRIALGVVVTLGFGFLSTPSSQAALLSSSITLTSATSTSQIGDTATNTIVVRFSGNSYDGTNDATKANTDSVTLRYTCDAPAGATCPTLALRQNQLSDTANIMAKAPANMDKFQAFASSGSSTDSLTSTTATGRSTYQVSTNGAFNGTPVGSAFDVAGTYTYNFYLTGSGANNVLTLSSGGTLVTWTVTVTTPSTTAASALVYISSDTNTAMKNHADWLNGPRSSDSAIVASMGAAATPAPVGYAYLNLLNANGDTRVAVGSGFNPVQDSVTVTVSGPGLVYAGDIGATGKTLSKSATLSVNNGRTAATNYPTETLVIYNDGTAGTMTLTFSKGTTTLATKTVAFYGAPASATGVSLSDTWTYLGATTPGASTRTVTLTAAIKDSGSNALSAGTLYVFSSDTKIAGAVPTTAVFGQTGHRCTTFTGTTAATYRLSCSVALTDTGVVTLTVGDSWTVAGSTFTSTPVTLTISGSQVGSATVAFDKATYKPGELAVVTITATDLAGRNFGSNGTTGQTGVFVTPKFTPSVTNATQDLGTQNTSSPTTTSFVNLLDGAVETRTILMPTYEGDVKFEISYLTPLQGTALTTVSATAKVVDPSVAAQNTLIANAQAAADAATAAAKAAGVAAQASADAATDAALQAIDAANAATDAANLAAEAADAATVAAQESKDAADAATAAVESLATQVATLMAALQAQITSLANVVAKIAKKVKA